MEKYPVGFNTKIKNEQKEEITFTHPTPTQKVRKSVVQVFFPSRGMNLAYFNDSFDLKVGDLVYVDGKLEGLRGQVTEVNYSFKIIPSDYKKVIAVIDTNVTGNLFRADSYLVSFDRNTIPFKKIN